MLQVVDLINIIILTNKPFVQVSVCVSRSRKTIRLCMRCLHATFEHKRAWAPAQIGDFDLAAGQTPFRPVGFPYYAKMA